MRFIWPLDNHYITRGFDYKSSIYIGGQHAAVDLVRLQGDTAGRDILAVADGVVVGDGFDSISGHHIILSHEDGWRSTYRHLAADAPQVMNQRVTQGEVIGNVGSTGLSTGPHLHLDLWHRERKDDTAFSKSGWWAHDPELYLGKEDEMSQAQVDALMLVQREQSVLFRDEATTAAILIQGTTHRLVDDPKVVAMLGYAGEAYLSVPHEYIMARAPTPGGPLTLAEAKAIAYPVSVDAAVERHEGKPHGGVEGPTMEEIAEGLEVDLRVRS